MLLVVQRIVLPAEGFHVHSEAFLSLPGTSPQYNSCTLFPLGALLPVCHFVAYGYVTILVRLYYYITTLRYAVMDLLLGVAQCFPFLCVLCANYAK